MNFQRSIVSEVLLDFILCDCRVRTVVDRSCKPLPGENCLVMIWRSEFSTAIASASVWGAVVRVASSTENR